MRAFVPFAGGYAGAQGTTVAATRASPVKAIKPEHVCSHAVALHVRAGNLASVTRLDPP